MQQRLTVSALVCILTLLLLLLLTCTLSVLH